MDLEQILISVLLSVIILTFIICSIIINYFDKRGLLKNDYSEYTAENCSGYSNYSESTKEDTSSWDNNNIGLMTNTLF